MMKQENHGCAENEHQKPVTAIDDDIAMTDEHWRVLWFMRDFRIKHRMPASVDDVVRFLAQDLAYGDRARSRLFELFPHAHAIHICKTHSGIE